MKRYLPSAAGWAAASTLMLLSLAAPGAAWAVAPQATERLSTCSWDRPGHRPFMGDVVGAVDHYRDIPPDVRARLKQRMAERQYDDMVSIRRDSIAGKETYGSQIRDMHFAQTQVCGTVTRGNWTPEMQERGLVYCESGHCILVPTVCRNVSRIDGPTTVAAAPASGPGELPFDPPGAGRPPPASPFDSFEGGSGGPLGGTPALPGPSFAAGSPQPGGDDGTGGNRPGEPRTPPFYPPILPPDGFPPRVPIPEPGTLALMLGGLALVGAARQRRRGAPKCATQKRP